MHRPILLIAVFVIVTTFAHAQVKTVPEYVEQVKALTNRSDIQAANDYIDRNHESIMREWIAITEINAPWSGATAREIHRESLA
jgi:hypothetical protein